MMASARQKPGAAFFVLNCGVQDGPSSNIFRYRDGAGYDQDNMHYLFITQFGFELINTQKTKDFYRSDWDHTYNPTKRECPKGAMCMMCLIKQTDYSSYENIVVHISSEGCCGDSGGIAIQFLSDSVTEYIPLAKIVEAFSDTSCPGLKGKTRILIIQACRHSILKPEEANDDGVPFLYGNKYDASEDAGNTHNNPLVIPDDEEQHELLPPHEVPEDFLIVFSTTTNRYAKRNTKTGSWFETELRNAVDAFRQDPTKGPDMDFLTILTETSDRVAKKESRSQNPNEDGKKNVPCFEHRLTKQIIFRCLQRMQLLNCS
ncbi:caspase-like [Dreissena polymorpha]|uniref:Uncharacterized protein n=1 Tax=Dreissena polymorpha TaxID=45954 RepID=A0A9D4S1C0_DREPO|nr:caspase-like [Dreissena polymorpha]XP_052236104.1 caspase-like [Dreissena polymorpha]KAH3888839.1 hypothetical protein DPMN_012880 [Dreissena polymorpha]